EDVIRHRTVTVVQTCALPILNMTPEAFSQLLPFLVRTWLYASGVMFSIQTIGSLRHHPTITYLLQINPAAVYIGLIRNSILQSQIGRASCRVSMLYQQGGITV